MLLALVVEEVTGTSYADVANPVYGMGWEPGEHRGEIVGGHGGYDPAFTAEVGVLPDRGRGFALLMNSGHLFDVVVARPRLLAGMYDVLQGRPAPHGGVSTKVLGAGLLAMTIAVAGLAVRSALRLRGWRDQARTLTTGRLVRVVAPRFVVPALIRLAVYQLSPLLLGRGFTLGYVGVYVIPDVTSSCSWPRCRTC